MLTFIKERSQKGINIHWQFTPQIARQKLNRRYCEVLFQLMQNLNKLPLHGGKSNV